jgi:shikimate dehydrogenase
MSRVALIGLPLKRRHSEVMHNAAFRHFGIDARYQLREIGEGDLDDFFATARGADWLGFQVTAPYKQDAVERCDEVEDAARRLGAVNSVRRRSDGSLIGFNTDAPGFARSVSHDLGLQLAGAAVGVAGAGGAARAVVAAVLGDGAARVVVGNRTNARAQALVDHFDDPRLEAVGLGEEFDERLASVDLAVNATTVGMIFPGVPFHVGRLPGRAAVFDLVYVPTETPLAEAARDRGLAVVNGAGMLVAQGAIAFERWTGIPGADPVMRMALEPMW